MIADAVAARVIPIPISRAEALKMPQPFIQPLALENGPNN
jgi:hypothetical protein